MAGSSLFTVSICGSGGHGSSPWLSNDPIKPACEMLLRLASLSSSRYSAFDSVVINPCSISAGTAGNIIPDIAEIKGNIRYFEPSHLEMIIHNMMTVISGISDSYGVTAELKLSDYRTPPMIASVDAFERISKTVSRTDCQFREMAQPWMASDNFSMYLAKYGGIYLFGGVAKAGEIPYPLHTPKFNPDEAALKGFCAVFLAYIDDFLSELTEVI